MIAYVKGIVADIAEDNVVIDVNGIGYNVKISPSTATLVPGVGEEVKMYTYTLVREDAFSLYGFLTRDDLEIFKKCITWVYCHNTLLRTAFAGFGMLCFHFH